MTALLETKREERAGSEAWSELGSVPTQRLEDEIGELAVQIHAATCRWLLLIGEFDRREGWKQWGAKSCGDWLSWRCGVAPRAAREQVRVARRLAELPAVRHAFGLGELSYSKARAISRAATPATELELVELARHATAAQLERLVRSYRGVISAELDQANRNHEERYLDWSWEEDGSLVVRGRLPAEDGAVLVRALEAARHHLRAGGGAPDPQGDSGSAEPPAEVHGGCTEPSADESAGRLEPAASGSSAAGSIRPGPHGGPEQRRDAGHGNADAIVAIAEASLAGAAHERGTDQRYQLTIHVDSEALSDDDPGARCEIEDGPALPPETARRMACDASLLSIVERNGRPLAVGRRTRRIAPALNRALRSRDGGCCFPGCTQRRLVDAHHIRHWAHGGETKLSNLLLLCRHHHRLVHEGGYRVEHHRHGMVFRRPDGRVIPAVPRNHPVTVGDEPSGGPRARLRVSPRTPAARSLGARFDCGAAVEGLLARDGLLGLERPPEPAKLRSVQEAWCVGTS